MAGLVGRRKRLSREAWLRRSCPVRWPVCRAEGKISRDRAGAGGDGAVLAAGAGTRSGKMAAAQEADGAGSAVVAAGGGGSGQVRRPRGARGVLPHPTASHGACPAPSRGMPCIGGSLPRGTLNTGPRWGRTAQEAGECGERGPVVRRVPCTLAPAGHQARFSSQRLWRGGDAD